MVLGLSLLSPRGPSIAEQVSMSLADKEAAKKAAKKLEEAAKKLEKPREESFKSSVSAELVPPRQSPARTQSLSQQDLPCLEECLYGPSKMSPVVPGDDCEEDDCEDEMKSVDDCVHEMKSEDDSIIDSDSDNGNENENDNQETNGGDNEKNNENGRPRSQKRVSVIEDAGLNSRWTVNEDIRDDYHDIDMTILRKLCSQGSGIPEDEGPLGRGRHDGEDEGSISTADSNANINSSAHSKTRGTCHRGVAWRVLLEQLPVRDVHATWPSALPPQRELYRELVEKYMDDAIDFGKQLKGESHWQQSLRDSKVADKIAVGDKDKGKDKVADTDVSDKDGDIDSDSDGDEHDAGNPAHPQSQQQQPQEDEDEDVHSVSESSLEVPPLVERSFSDSKDLDASGNIRATEDIYDVFPPTSKYKELWHRIGITLNQGESAAAIRMNRLRIPKELISEDDGTEDGNTTTEGENSAEGKQNDETNSGETADADTPDPEDTTISVSGIAIKCRKDAIFEQFCKDAKLLSEIRKDVVRTNPHLRFFLEPRNNLGIRRHAAMERILYVWAKLNKNLYVQGMNEIVGVLYYVLAMDPTTSSHASEDDREKQKFWADHAEADTYYLFQMLMNTMDFRDVFVADLDHTSSTGLHARISNIEMLLQKHDPEVFNHMKGNLGLDSSFYAIRWLTTLLSREFQLPDTIRLWDSMFASTHKENFLRYVCTTMVMAVRDQLLLGDFGTCLKLLQNYPSGDIGMDELLESSRNLYVYETQISMACQKGGIALRKALRIIPPPDGVIMAFGRPGLKPLRLHVRVTPFPTIDSETTNSNNNNSNINVRKNILGAAKRLWSWGTPTSTPTSTKKVAETITDTENAADKDKNANADEEWDLIDNIIDGKTEYVCSSMTSSSKAVSSTEPAATPSTTPASSPSKTPSRLWKQGPAVAKHITPTTDATNTSGFDDDDDDDDGVVEDFKNDDDLLSKSMNGKQKVGIWARMRRQSMY